MLLAGVALWSLGTLVAPPCAHAGLLALCASRVIVRTAPAPPLSDIRLAEMTLSCCCSSCMQLAP